MGYKANYLPFVTAAQIKQLECEKIKFELVNLKPHRLKRPSYSSRIPIDNKMQALANSLYSNGLIGGLFIKADNFEVIDGWQRLELCKSMGYDLISCYLIDCSHEKAKQLHLSFNQQSADFDLSKFGLEFNEVNLEDFGFTEIELNDCKAIMNGIQNEYEIDENESPIRIKRPAIPTTLETVEKIDAIKYAQRLSTRNDAITFLLEYYEGDKSRA